MDKTTEHGVYGIIPQTTTMDETTSKGGRPGKTLWLNEGQCILAAVRSDAPLAVEVRHQVITVFMAWRRAQTTVQVGPGGRRPPEREITRLGTAIYRLERALNIQARAETLDKVSAMLHEMHRRNEAHHEDVRLIATAVDGLVAGQR